MALSLKAMIVVKNGFRGKLGFENISSPQKVQNLCSNCAANCGNTFGPRPWTNETLAAAILWPYVAINPRSKKGTPQSPQPKADLTRPHSTEAGGKSMNGSRWSAQNETPHVTPCYTIGLTSYHFAGQYLQYQRRSNICTWSRCLDRTSMTISWSSKQFVCLWVALSQSFLCGRYCTSQQRQMLHTPRANTTRLRYKCKIQNDMTRFSVERRVRFWLYSRGTAQVWNFQIGKICVT